MSYLISPRDQHAALTCAQDEREARARMAKWDLEASPMDVAEAKVKRVIRAAGGRPGSYRYQSGILTYTYWGISINKMGEIDWGSFVFNGAAK